MTTFAGREIGAGNPVLMIAEMAWAHDGTRQNALRIAQGAIDAGADFLNIHLTSMPDYMVRTYRTTPGRLSTGADAESVYSYLARIALTDEDWESVAELAHHKDLALSCMANDVASIELADRLGTAIYAVPPACMVERPYMEAIAERQKPILLGIGGAELAEIDRTLEFLARKNVSQVMLQYGIQNYPTDPRDLSLRYLRTLQDLFGLPMAYHDHTEAGTSLASEIPIMALGLGVAAIEKHMTYDRSVKGEDHESAMEPAELAQFEHDLRVAEAALGQSTWRPLTDTEQNYRRVVRKRAVAREDLPAGTPLTFESVTFKRADDGLYPEQFEALIGRRTRMPLAAEAPIVAGVID